MATQKMVYVSSNDYWGYSKADFNTALNFYEYTWVVPQTMYEGMDEENQSQLYPCALFYVQGVTDNHNFLTLSVKVDSDDAKVVGMKGRKRKTISFNVGSPFSYKVGGLSMKEAPKGSTSVESIQTGVTDGSNTSDGSFIVSGFLTEPEQIAEAVGLQSEEKSAESPLDVPATPSEYEPANPQVNPTEESYSAEEISDAYPQESAQTDGYTSGRGVPVAYGSGSSQNLEPPVIVDEEMSAEEITDSYPQSSAEVGGESSGRGVPVAYGSGSSQYLEPPVIVDDEYMSEYDQGYDDELDESLGERDGAERNFSQSRKSRRDESKGTEKYDDSRPYSSVGTMDAEQVGLPVIPDSYGTDSATEMSGRGVPVWYGSAEDFDAGDSIRFRWKLGQLMDEKDELVNECYAVLETGDTDKCKKLLKEIEKINEALEPMMDEYEEQIEQARARNPTGWDAETTDFYPQSSAEIGDEQSGYGVPVSYGSGSSQYIEPPVIVDEEMAAEYQHSRRGSGGRFRSKRDIRNEVFGETMENQMRGYWRTGIVGTNPVVGNDVARSNDNKRFNYFSKPAEYNENRRQWNKGPNFRQARKIAKGVAWERVEKLGLAAEAGEANPMEFAELGAYDVPVIPNTVGTDSAGGSGYGVPQWYGADTMVDSLEEGAPPALANKPKVIGLAAVIGLIGGAWMARKN